MGVETKFEAAEFYQEIDLIQQLRDEYVNGAFRKYAADCLWIRTKEAGLKRLVLNDNQRLLDELIEEQKQRTGRVRVIVLKGRQEGVSTYIQGRLIRHTTTKYGKHAFILTHEKEATENLFGMANRMYHHLPSFLRPATGKANAKELSFELLDSGYSIGTAGNKAVGRSQTIHYFHGSEVGFWPNAEEHTKGVLQAVPDANDTEIILEGTANGINNYFHRFWKSAEAGETEFIAIFLPWYWMEEYQKQIPVDFQITDEERLLSDHYGLTANQIFWRRNKINEFNAAEGVNSGIVAFKQEYPMNPAEAFQFSGGDTLITSEMCMPARKRSVEGFGPLYVGVDPSFGGDRFAVVWRWGAKMYDYAIYPASEIETFQQRVAICVDILNNPDPVAERLPDMMCIDFAVGKDIVDELRRMGFAERVREVNFAEKPKLKRNQEKYGNRRNEMYGLMTEWLVDEEFLCEIPDSDEFQADLCATPFHFDVYERKILDKKDAIKKEYGFSPDLADAAALTFAWLFMNEGPVELPRPMPCRFMDGTPITGMNKYSFAKRFSMRRRNSDGSNIQKIIMPNRQEIQQTKVYKELPPDRMLLQLQEMRQQIEKKRQERNKTKNR